MEAKNQKNLTSEDKHQHHQQHQQQWQCPSTSGEGTAWTNTNSRRNSRRLMGTPRSRMSNGSSRGWRRNLIGRSWRLSLYFICFLFRGWSPLILIWKHLMKPRLYASSIVSFLSRTSWPSYSSRTREGSCASRPWLWSTARPRWRSRCTWGCFNDQRVRESPTSRN